MLNSLLQMFLKLFQKPAGTIGDTTGNKISDKIARVSKTSLQNNLVTNEE